MQVSVLMSKQVETITPDINIQQASRRMRDQNIGALPVMIGHKLVGIITDRDIGCFAVAMGYIPLRTSVEQIMSTDVTTCRDSDSINDAGQLMKQRHIRRLVVLNRHNSIVGLLSVDDLARCSHELAGAVLEAADAVH